MNRKEIENKIDNGEWLTDAELTFARKHDILLWGCANEVEYHDSLPEPDLPCMPLLTDGELESMQARFRRFS